MVGLIVLVVILAAVAGYLFATRMMTTSSGCPSISSMDMTGSGNLSMSAIKQNATTTDYKLMLVLGPPENMLIMCQVTNATMSDEVMLGGQMMSVSTDANMNMDVPTYHLEVHIFDIKTGAAIVVPLNSITITIKNSSGVSTSVPVAEMFGVMQGPTDIHYGNNVQLVNGKYTIALTVEGKSAVFNIIVG